METSIIEKTRKGWKLKYQPKNCRKLSVPDRSTDFSNIFEGCEVVVGEKTHDNQPSNPRKGVAFYKITHSPNCEKCAERAAFQRRSEWVSSILSPEKGIVEWALAQNHLGYPKYVSEETAALVSSLNWIRQFGLKEGEKIPSLDRLPQAIEAVQIMNRLNEVVQRGYDIAHDIRERAEKKFPYEEDMEIFLPKKHAEPQKGDVKVTPQGVFRYTEYGDTAGCSDGSVVDTFYMDWKKIESADPKVVEAQEKVCRHQERLWKNHKARKAFCDEEGEKLLAPIEEEETELIARAKEL